MSQEATLGFLLAVFVFQLTSHSCSIEAASLFCLFSSYVLVHFVLLKTKAVHTLGIGQCSVNEIQFVVAHVTE